MRSESQHRAQTGSLHQECSQGGSGDRAGARSQTHHQVDSQNKQTHSQDHIWESQNRRVSFRMPGGEDSVTESREPSDKLPIKDLESWLDHQADELGTPTWWGELKAIPGIMDLCRFAQKIHVSFHVPEIRSQASPNQGYSAPPAPKVSTEEPSYLKGWNTKMCSEGQSSSLKHTANVYSIGWKRFICWHAWMLAPWQRV